jgi:small-conductance mechanosensitive channel
MAFDLNVFAAEFGIDPATLQAKPEVFKKWNGYLTEADGKYQTATEAQKQAQAALDAVKNEQAAIDEKIKSFSLTEAQVDTLRANYAALEAQAKALKSQGYNLNIPETPTAPAKVEFDPNRFQQDVNGSLVAGFNVMNRYGRLYGKALPDDLDALAREAAQAHMPFSQYVEKKYDFAGEEKRQAEKASLADKEAYAAQKLKEYQEAHPVTVGNPELIAPGASRFPELAKRPTPQKHENYGGSPAQRIARSVKRSLEGLAAAS